MNTGSSSPPQHPLTLTQPLRCTLLPAWGTALHPSASRLPLTPGTLLPPWGQDISQQTHLETPIPKLRGSTRSLSTSESSIGMDSSPQSPSTMRRAVPQRQGEPQRRLQNSKGMAAEREEKGSQMMRQAATWRIRRSVRHSPFKGSAQGLVGTTLLKQESHKAGVFQRGGQGFRGGQLFRGCLKGGRYGGTEGRWSGLSGVYSSGGKEKGRQQN